MGATLFWSMSKTLITLSCSNWTCCTVNTQVATLGQSVLGLVILTLSYLLTVEPIFIFVSCTLILAAFSNSDIFVLSFNSAVWTDGCLKRSLVSVSECGGAPFTRPARLGGSKPACHPPVSPLPRVTPRDTASSYPPRESQTLISIPISLCVQS